MSRVHIRRGLRLLFTLVIGIAKAFGSVKTIDFHAFFMSVPIFDILDLPQKCRNRNDFCRIICIYQKKAVLLRRKNAKQQKLW